MSQGDDGALSAATRAADALHSAAPVRLLEAQPSSRCPTTLLRTSELSFFRKSTRAPACHASMGMYPSYPASTRLAHRQSRAPCQRAGHRGCGRWTVGGQRTGAAVGIRMAIPMAIRMGIQNTWLLGAQKDAGIACRVDRRGSIL